MPGKTISLGIQTNLSPEMVYRQNCHHVGKTKVSTDTMSMNVCFIFICRWGDMLGPDASLDVKVRLSRISREYNTLGENYIDILISNQLSFAKTHCREVCVWTRPCLNERLYNIG